MSILDKIVTDTRNGLVARKREMPTAALRDRALYDEPRRGFERSLREHEIAIIAELKRRSPSKGDIRLDFDVADLARAYTVGGASAISVLTERMHFGGSIEFLETARFASSVPLLRKDFIIDPYQVVEARAYGADAVLLIATILCSTQLKELQDACDDEGLDALVEVYQAEEIDRIDTKRTPVVGANNRDLNTFEVDIDRSLRILSLLPSSTLTVAESGLSTPDEIAYLIRHGIDAFLIGESFMVDPAPGDLLARWIQDIRTKLLDDVS